MQPIPNVENFQLVYTICDRLPGLVMPSDHAGPRIEGSLLCFFSIPYSMTSRVELSYSGSNRDVFGSLKCHTSL